MSRNNETFQLNYEDGILISGYLSQDNLLLGSYIINNQIFGEVTQYSNSFLWEPLAYDVLYNKIIINYIFEIICTKYF